MRTGRKPGTPKTGGRKQGVPNKRTVQVAERLRELHCDPLEGLVRLVMDETLDPTLRGRLYCELCKYVYPQRKAVEHSLAEDEEPFQFTLNIGEPLERGEKL